MNFFATKTAAARYAKGRPFFHPLLVNRIREFLSLTNPMDRALDVGCGTGLSSLALSEIASQVVGVDASKEMLTLAPQSRGIQYLVAKAERLPFTKGSFELMTLSQVFHWLEPGEFLAEARRVLTGEGWIVAYDDYLTGQMEGSTEFLKWFNEIYKSRYPRVVRQWTSFEPEVVERAGFRLVAHEWHGNTIHFSGPQLADYLVSQSSVIAKVERGDQNVDDVKSWICEAVKPFFGGSPTAAFVFTAPIWFLQKIAL